MLVALEAVLVAPPALVLLSPAVVAVVTALPMVVAAAVLVMPPEPVVAPLTVLLASPACCWPLPFPLLEHEQARELDSAPAMSNGKLSLEENIDVCLSVATTFHPRCGRGMI